MLKQRLITAALLIPLIVWALLSLDTLYITILLALVASLAAWEWLTMIGMQRYIDKVLLIVVLLALAWLTMMFLPAVLILSVSTFIWLLASLLVMCFANQPLTGKIVKLISNKVFNIILMIWILISFVEAGGLLHSQSPHGPMLLLYVLVTVWLADTGGYFIGKRYGKHKLAKDISPNKTWQGALGGLVFALIFGVIAFYVINPTIPLWLWLLLNSFVVIVSIVGDLFESVLKRCFDLKDSGQLLPGHGGMLDRIDSQLSAIPLFVVALATVGAGSI